MMSWDMEVQQFNTPVRWDALLFGKSLQSTLTRKGTFAYFNGRFRYTSSSLLFESALAFSTNNDDLTSRKIQSRELETRTRPPTSVHVAPLANPPFSALKKNKKQLKKLLAVSDDASEQNKHENGQLENIIKDLTAKHETAVALTRKYAAALAQDKAVTTDR
ncbi:hypothetical protein ARMGADRAFT_1024625 [Armillaria gallica]|uniref:Uncharacterized protein n=1 Tax=Armillaria gallica TaxID=47427 RepID=A0A2H3EL41_ARMGA|nr:hypothetical protein ARMGADRAFT_1024625 [Armillaria gallica]